MERNMNLNKQKRMISKVWKTNCNYSIVDSEHKKIIEDTKELLDKVRRTKVFPRKDLICTRMKSMDQIALRAEVLCCTCTVHRDVGAFEAISPLPFVNKKIAWQILAHELVLFFFN